MEKRPLILVADNEQGILKIISRALELEGFNVKVATHGLSALAMFEEHKPDLIIMDIMMPELDGFQVLELIRQRSDIPVIMLSAKEDVATLCEALTIGANDYIRKPFRISELVARVRVKLRHSLK